jgi:serine/threonine-protein kinase ULK/ATG1
MSRARAKTLSHKLVSVGSYNVSRERLGRGSSATVYLGYHKKSGIEVAVKKFELAVDNDKILKRAEREIQILQSLSHPNIIKLYEIVRDRVNRDIYLFLEYCPHGSLRSFLGKGGYLEEKQGHQIMKQLSDALKHLYERNIYHRDLKPQNLLLSRNYNLKVIDFGFATLNTRASFRRLCGSPMYMAPEIIRSGFYDRRSDLWSIGIILYEILFGQHPFAHIKHFYDLARYANDRIYIELPPKDRPARATPSPSTTKS